MPWRPEVYMVDSYPILKKTLLHLYHILSYWEKKMNTCIFSSVSWTACRERFWLENRSAEKAIPTFTAALCNKKKKKTKPSGKTFMHWISGVVWPKERTDQRILTCWCNWWCSSCLLYRTFLWYPQTFWDPKSYNLTFVVWMAILRKWYGMQRTILPLKMYWKEQGNPNFLRFVLLHAICS